MAIFNSFLYVYQRVLFWNGHSLVDIPKTARRHGLQRWRQRGHLGLIFSLAAMAIFDGKTFVCNQDQPNPAGGVVSNIYDIYLSIFLSFFFFFFLFSFYLSIYLSLSIYLYLSISIYLSLSTSIYLSLIYLSLSISICLSVCLSLSLSIYRSIYLSIHPSIYLSLSLSI